MTTLHTVTHSSVWLRSLSPFKWSDLSIVKVAVANLVNSRTSSSPVPPIIVVTTGGYRKERPQQVLHKQMPPPRGMRYLVFTHQRELNNFTAINIVFQFTTDRPLSPSFPTSQQPPTEIKNYQAAGSMLRLSRFLR